MCCCVTVYCYHSIIQHVQLSEICCTKRLSLKNKQTKIVRVQRACVCVYTLLRLALVGFRSELAAGRRHRIVVDIRILKKKTPPRDREVRAIRNIGFRPKRGYDSFSVAGAPDALFILVQNILLYIRVHLYVTALYSINTVAVWSERRCSQYAMRCAFSRRRLAGPASGYIYGSRRYIGRSGIILAAGGPPRFIIFSSFFVSE